MVVTSLKGFKMRDIPSMDSKVRYQVHFEYTSKRTNRIKRGCRHVVAWKRGRGQGTCPSCCSQ